MEKKNWETIDTLLFEEESLDVDPLNRSIRKRTNYYIFVCQ